VNYEEKYLKRSMVAGRILRFVPFLRMAGLNGSLSRGEAKQSSDIDFLIIARDGRLYTARFFAVLLVALTGWRRSGKKIAGRICLNCYLSASHPDVVPHNPQSNKKVAIGYRYLIPLVDDGKTAKKFFKINKWMGKNLKCRMQNEKFQPKADPPLTEKFKIINKYLKEKIFLEYPKQPKRTFEKLLSGRFGNFVERKLMDYERRRILGGACRGDEIFADEKEIRLHPQKN